MGNGASPRGVPSGAFFSHHAQTCAPFSTTFFEKPIRNDRRKQNGNSGCYPPALSVCSLTQQIQNVVAFSRNRIIRRCNFVCVHERTHSRACRFLTKSGLSCHRTEW